MTKLERQQRRVLALVKKWRREAAEWPDAFQHELKLYRAVIKLEELEMLQSVERTKITRKYPVIYCTICKRRHRSNMEHTIGRKSRDALR